MRAVSTYCSASKDPAKGLIPAFKRYVSARIVRVQEIAEKQEVPFCILSGEFGLVDWNQPLPWYDHLLLVEEVPQLVEKVARQLIEKGITQLDYYTQSPKSDPKLLPYINAIEKSCGNANVDLHVFILEEAKLSATMRNWKQIMELAADARQILIVDRVKGELEFRKLLALYPDDGMVYWERGSGYEAIGESTLAKADYEIAKQFFPIERWQWEAQEALNRIARDIASGGTIAEAQRRISVLSKMDTSIRQQVLAAIARVGTDPTGTAAELRKTIESLVNRLLKDHRIVEGDDLDSRIGALRNHAIVPEIVVNHMHTIRITGNRALHPKAGEPMLQSGDIYPSITAFVAILEWLNQ